MQIFRQEVLEARQEKLHGDVFLTTPVSFSLVTLLLATFVAGGLILLFTGNYTRTERVSGHLVPTSGLVKLRAEEFGSIETLYVQENDDVRAGSPIASISLAQLTVDGSSVEARSLTALKEQKRNIESQLLLEEKQLSSELGRMHVESDAMKLEISQFIGLIEIQKELTASVGDIYNSMPELLEQGFMSKTESEQGRQNWLLQQRQERLREQELESAKARLALLKIRLEQLPNESAVRISRLKGSLIDLDIQAAELAGRTTSVVRAPVDGSVVSISSSATHGQSVVPEQILLTIMPKGSRLVAELFIPSHASGFIREGQEVRLLYTAFPYQRFGSYPAEIVEVTRTILSPSEANAPFAIEQPVYRVRAALKTDTVTVGNEEIALQSGMQLDANIILEKRSFIDWLLEPLRAVGGRE